MQSTLASLCRWSSSALRLFVAASVFTVALGCDSSDEPSNASDGAAADARAADASGLSDSSATSASDTASSSDGATGGADGGASDAPTPTDTGVTGNVDAAASNDTGGTAGLPSAAAAKVAVGRLHTCALTTAGAVRCWGVSRDGQVGNDTFSEASVSVPVQVVGLGSGVSAIASGADHACAVTSGGGVKCWGANDKGQLGNDSTTRSGVPVDVVGLSSGVSAIAAGFAHTCAIAAGGTVKCWGENGNGKLGNDAEEDSKVPVAVGGLTGVTAIAVGRTNTCAVTSAGAVKCWGGNAFGELGNDSTTRSPLPVDVMGLSSGFASVSTGSSLTCAISTAGAAKCWGKNTKGELGDNAGGLGVETHVPVDVSGVGSGATAIAAAYEYACAVVGGAVKCWGNTPAGTMTLVPVTVPGLTAIASISAGPNHVCVVTNAGAVKCWGSNDGGQLGDGSQTDAPAPVSVINLP